MWNLLQYGDPTTDLSAFSPIHVATPKSANLAEPSLVVKIFGPLKKKIFN